MCSDSGMLASNNLEVGQDLAHSQPLQSVSNSSEPVQAQIKLSRVAPPLLATGNVRQATVSLKNCQYIGDESTHAKEYQLRKYHPEPAVQQKENQNPQSTSKHPMPLHNPQKKECPPRWPWASLRLTGSRAGGAFCGGGTPWPVRRVTALSNSSLGG